MLCNNFLVVERGVIVDIKKMIGELEEFYECAGFENYYERVLKNTSDSEIKEHYDKTFKEEDRELVDWERQHHGDL